MTFWKYFHLLVFKKIRFDISCKLSRMYCQTLNSGEREKNGDSVHELSEGKYGISGYPLTLYALWTNSLDNKLLTAFDTIFVLKFEQVQFTTAVVFKKCWTRGKQCRP